MLPIEELTPEQLREAKIWFFQENVRIEQAKLELEEQKKALENDKKQFHKQKQEFGRKRDITLKQINHRKDLFQKQWDVLERELRKLAKDRERLEYDRNLLIKERNVFEQMRSETKITKLDVSTFFKGVSNEKNLKKRYRELLKIFHPDNMCGDNGVLQAINKEYDDLKKVIE